MEVFFELIEKVEITIDNIINVKTFLFQCTYILIIEQKLYYIIIVIIIIILMVRIIILRNILLRDKFIRGTL